MNDTPTTYGLPKKREEVIEQLKLAYSEENLEEDEYERRLQEAVDAKSIEGLKLVIFDFPSSIRDSIFTKKMITPPRQEANFPEISSQNKIQTVLGSDSYNVPTLLPKMPQFLAVLSEQSLDFRLSQVSDDTVYLSFKSVFSSTVVDLRNENLERKTINIHITGSFGNVKILLPRRCKVQKNLQSIVSNFDIIDKRRSWTRQVENFQKPPAQNATYSTVNITGNFWFGSIEVFR